MGIRGRERWEPRQQPPATLKKAKGSRGEQKEETEIQKERMRRRGRRSKNEDDKGRGEKGSVIKHWLGTCCVPHKRIQDTRGL